jgi:hypothetical protein
MSTPLKLDPTLQTPRPEPEMRPGPAKTPSAPKPDPKSKSESKDSSTIFGQAKQTLDLITDNAVGGAVSLAYEVAEATKAAKVGAALTAFSKVASPLSIVTSSKGFAEGIASGDVEATLENGLSFTANTIGTTVVGMGQEAAKTWLPRVGPAGSLISAGIGGYALGKSGDAYLRRQNGASPADLATTKAVQTHDGILKLTGSPVLAEAMGLHELGRGMIDAVVPTVTGGVLALGERVLEATGLKKPRA